MTEENSISEPVAVPQSVSQDTVLQCGLCHRQHDGWGSLTGRRICVPLIMECGRDDCAEVMEGILSKQRQRDVASHRRDMEWQQRRKPAKAPARCDRHEAKRELRQLTSERPAASLPYKDSELGDEVPAADPASSGLESPGHRQAGKPALLSAPAAERELPHAERQRAFVAEGRGDNDNQRMLELLWGKGSPVMFDPMDAGKVSRGPWISKDVFIFEHRILTPNSRASELRGSDTHPGHALVNRWGLDIDNSSDGAVTGHAGGVSCYSVCFREASHRLAREKRDVSSTL